MTFASILVLTDPGRRDDPAIGRAGQLAAEHGARLASEPRRGGRCDNLARAALDADLVVVAHRRERGLRSFFMGLPAIDIVRVVRRPVLVVRRAATDPYGRVLALVDFGPASQPLLRLASAVQPGASLELFHAISTRNEAMLRSAEATERALRLYRRQCVEFAQDRMALLKDSLGPGAREVMAALGHGDPARQAAVHQQRCGADLLVVGKRPTGAWTEFLCGSVASRLLDATASDLLLVPSGADLASRAHAVHRLRPEAARTAAWSRRPS